MLRSRGAKSRGCCARRLAPTPQCRSRCSTIRGYRPPITGSASPAAMVQASRPPLPSFGFDWVKTSIELDVERQIVAQILSLATWPARSKLAGIRFEQAELRAAEETLRLAAEHARAYIRAVAARQILTALRRRQSKRDPSASLSESLHANRRGQQAPSMPSDRFCHRDGGASDRGASASRGFRRTANADVGPMGDEISQGCCRTRCRRSRSCAKPWTGRAAGDGAEGRSRRGPARGRGARPFLRAHAQDAVHQCARRRRHLQDAKGQRRSLRPTAVASTLLSRCRFTISAIARVREAEQRYLEAINALAQKAVNAPLRSCVRRLAPTKRATPSPHNMSTRCCRSERRSLRRPSCNSTPCRSMPSRCSKRRAPRRMRKWQASRRGGISGLPRPISASPCSAAEA